MLEQINLQLFNDDDIPSELEGVSEEIAREVMAEMNVTDESTEEVQEEVQGEVQEEVQEEVEKEEENDGDADTENKGNVPYNRFKEVNDKYRQIKAEREELEKQLAALRQQKEVEPPFVEQQEAPKQKVADKATMDLLEEAYSLAKQQVLTAYNLSSDDYQDLEYQDSDEKGRIDRAINFQYQAICDQAREQARVMQEQRNQEVRAYQEAYQDYAIYAEEEQKRDDFTNIWEYASTERFGKLQPYQQMLVQNSFTAVNSGQPTLEQIQIVRDYYDMAKAEYLNRAPQQSTKVEKIKQMAKSPRVDKVRGTPSTGGLSIAEIERMVQEEDWSKIDPTIKEQLLNGRLR